MVEREWRSLVELRPTFMAMICATIGPMLLHLVDKSVLEKEHAGLRKIHFRLLKPNDDYLGFDDFVPLKDIGGEGIYLEDTLKYNKGQGSQIGNSKPVPFSDENVMRMYDNALEHCPTTPKADSLNDDGVRRRKPKLGVSDAVVF